MLRHRAHMRASLRFPALALAALVLALASAEPGSPQLDALLELRPTIDPRGALADVWTRPAGGGGGYCAFVGVACDSGRNVVALDFEGWGWLGGALPPASALAALPRLRVINFDDNGMAGTLPPDWGGLGSLEEIRLGTNSLTGPIPPEWAGLSKLRVLHLHWNRLSGSLSPEFGAGWPLLEELSLDTNGFEGRLPEEMARLTRLKTLLLHDNQLSGTLSPAFGGGWPRLEVMTLYHNQLTGPLPAEWGAMTKLRQLFIFGNKLTGPLPASWAGLKSLAAVDLSDNDLEGGVPPPWGGLGKHLRTLRLGGNGRLDACGALPKGLEKLEVPVAKCP
ncbi:MAG: hypothetical protein J3K34DRAFT_425415 [Monoraphidium minutum]|nr:MAG: hypothetical protein J3K34DRAFT_425415 [Monoraphidium minutum]